jgi:F-type H+-transporting ATPase subunit b
MGHSLMRQSRLIQIAAVFVCLLWAGPLSAQSHGEAADTTQGQVTQQAHDAADQAVAPGGDAADDQGAGHGEVRGLTTVKWQEALYTIVVFGIFFVVLSVFVWPKILGSLQAREEKVRGDLRGAEDAAKAATATLAEYKQQLAEAQKQAQRIVDESRGAAQQVAAQVKEQAQGEMTQMRERAEADINAAKERAVSEIYEQTAMLATEVAGKILRREINAGDQESLVRESIAKLNDAGQN